MAKHRRKHRKHNPIGTLLVNSGRKRNGGKSARAKRTKKTVSLARLLAKSNPRPKARRRAGRRGVKRNSLLMNRRRKHNPVLVNRGHKRAKHRRHHRRGRKHNPVLINRGRKHRRGKYKRNPSSGGGIVYGTLGKASGLVKKVPVVGGILGTAVMGLAGALAGGVAVFPISYALPYVSKWVPDWLKPFAYTTTGVLLSAGVRALPVAFPYKNELALGLTFSGGAIDAYRFKHGKSHDLGDEYGDEYGSDEMGDDLGDDGSPLAAVEFLGADLHDAEYAGDDLSDAEMAAAELGREVFRRRFLRPAAHRPAAHRRGGDGTPGPSVHAGYPGERWGWLIYWVGFDQFQELAKMDEAQRRGIIARLKSEAHVRARKLLGEQQSTSMTSAETAGLLAVG